MANKEAVVIVLDVGPTMGMAAPGYKSSLDLSLECIRMVIQRKIFLDPKDEVAMILCGTETTKNALATEAESNDDFDQYQNISRMRGLTMADWDLIEELEGITASNQNADIIDALVVALDLLKSEGKGKKFVSLKILLFSDLNSDLNDDDLDSIIQGFNSFSTPLDIKIISPFAIDDDSEDIELPFKVDNDADGVDQGQEIYRKTKSKQQIKASNILSNILSQVDGVAGTFSDIIPGMKYYLSGKSARAMPWKVNLTVGSDLAIPVAAFKKVCPTTRKTWEKTFAEDDSIKLATDVTFHLNDEAQSEIEKDDTISAYCYGSTMVPFTDEDKVNMEYQVESKCLSVIGFTKQSNVVRHHFVGDKVDFVFAEKDDDAASVALSAMIHAMFETEMVAIARYAYSARSKPRLVMLAPRIKSQLECLVSIQLPFMEDLRQFTFAPLDVLKKNVPSDTQLELMDQLITEMDLSASEETQFHFHPSNYCDPYQQRYLQCLHHRATHPEDPLPDFPQHLQSMIQPPSQFIESCEKLLEKIKESFPLEKIISKSKGQTGAAIFDVEMELKEESAAKRFKADDNLDGGIANIIGSLSQPKDEVKTEEEEASMNIEQVPEEPDEADDLLDMM